VGHLVGIVHGLAGSAGVALLLLTMIHNSRWAVAYFLIFGLGTKRSWANAFESNQNEDTKWSSSNGRRAEGSAMQSLGD